MKTVRTLRMLAVLAAALAFPLISRAQQAAPAAPATPGKDVQARFEPPSGPGAGQEFLKKFEGEWTVERIFYPPSGGSPSRATGEATQKMVQGGRFLESDFTFHTPDGKTSTGTGISGFDPATGLFTTFWYDSRSTHFSVRQSRDPFDGQQIVLYSVSLAGSHGQEHTSRTVSFLEDGGKRLVHRQYNADASGNEKVLMELILTRKG
ncbi:MAG TPA: DUF1579 family protein [Thermoanaerobaculia bacterium]|nr:DUF1579 family protein [Thermoanaerobaculia bacterium]